MPETSLATELFRVLLSQGFLATAILLLAVIMLLYLLATIWRAYQEQLRVSAELSRNHVAAMNEVATSLQRISFVLEERGGRR